jgi:aminoglycoside phosphotransferase (APT) family kinase protein
MSVAASPGARPDASGARTGRQRLRSNDLPPIDDETPFGGRLPLAEQDAATRGWITQAGDLIDGPAVTAAWEDAAAGPAWDGAYAWIHSDLLPPNLLVKDGRLCAVIDFGAAGLGDPATDLNPAWSVFGQAGPQSLPRPGPR